MAKRVVMKLPANLGMLLLAIWLIIQGAVPLVSGGTSLNIGIGTIEAILAIVAGILILMKR
jgi:hypothetical protein